MKIADTYKPYNFSSTKCYVFQVTVASGKFIVKIENKLPLHFGVLKGLYFTCNSLSTEKVVGYISLFLNEGIFKSIQTAVINTNRIRHQAHPIPFDEEVKTSAYIQGFFFNRDPSLTDFTITIYLHYEEKL